jgi:hypothetical protein
MTCALAACLWTSVANADNAQPITLTVTQDQARIADALAILQQETGYTIVVDSTVIGRIGAAKVSFPNLPKMLDFLKTVEPGLTYAHIYIAKNQATPSGRTCYDLVRTMQWLSSQGNPVLVTQAGTISIVHQAAPLAATPPGMREIWYVSDEQTRAQQLLDLQKMQQEQGGPEAPSSESGANFGPRRPLAADQRQYEVAPGLDIQR